MASARQIAEREAKRTGFQLHPKKVREKPEAIAEMTPDQLRAFDNAAREANRWIGNIGCAIEEPSREQAKRMDDTLRKMVEQIEAHRYRLVGQ